MKQLFNLKNRVEDLYLKSPVLMGYFTRLVITILVLIVLRGNIGFNPILTNILFVCAYGVVCSFLPSKLLLLGLSAYVAVQVFSLAAGAGILTCILVIIAYLAYYRFDEKNGYVIILIPLLCMIRMPALIPLVLAVTAPVGTVVSALLGYFIYNYLHYLHINTAVIQGMTDKDEIQKMSMIIQGIITNKELWFTLLCLGIMFVAVYYLKRINVNKSNMMAISVGSGLYLIMTLVSNLLLGVITYNRLFWIVAGTIVSWALAVILTGVILPLDYNRTELLEFEDDEYKYYVRAVPKAAISRETVRIKRIYTRKHETPSGKKEEGKT